MNFNCIFCHKLCQQWKSDKHFFCPYCNVSYEIVYDDMLNAIIFHQEREDAFYHLSLLIQDNKTEIFKISKDPIQPASLILSIKPVLGGVTPQNVAEKLQMLLWFS